MYFFIKIQTKLKKYTLLFKQYQVFGCINLHFFDTEGAF